MHLDVFVRFEHQTSLMSCELHALGETAVSFDK